MPRLLSLRGAHYLPALVTHFRNFVWSKLGYNAHRKRQVLLVLLLVEKKNRQNCGKQKQGYAKKTRYMNTRDKQAHYPKKVRGGDGAEKGDALDKKPFTLSGFLMKHSFADTSWQNRTGLCS